MKFQAVIVAAVAGLTFASDAALEAQAQQRGEALSRDPAFLDQLKNDPNLLPEWSELIVLSRLRLC
jgi:hypothetical protein